MLYLGISKLRKTVKLKKKVMLENFKNGYEVSKKSKIAQGEKNDCVVRALANAFNISYNVSHKFVSDEFGRKSKKGTFNTRNTLKSFSRRTLKFDHEGQLNLFDNSDHKEFKISHIGDQPKDGGKLHNPKYTWTNKVAYTVKEFAQKYNVGTYVLLVKKHALTIKDGIVIDNPDMKFTGYRRPVKSAFKVSK